MHTALRYVAAAVFALSSATAVIYAQQNTPTAPHTRSTPGWVFTPSIGFGGSWDSNVLLANPGNEPPSDYATPFSPGASIDYLGRRVQFSSGYEGSFLMYRTLDALNSAQHLGRASLEYRASRRLKLFADEHFERAPTTDALDLAGVPFYRVGSRTNASGGGFEAAVARHTTLRGRYTLRDVSFDADPRTAANLQGGIEHDVNVSVGHALSSTLTVGAEYDLRHEIMTEGLNTFNINTGGVSVNYIVTPTLSLTGMVGISYLGDGVTHESRVGPAVSAGAAKRTKYVIISGTYAQSFVPAFGFGGTFQNRALTGTIHVPFARARAYAEGSATRSDNEPIDPTQPSLVSVWLSTTVGYRLSRWLRAEGFYDRTEQSSDRPGSDLNRNQVGFRFVAAKPVRLR